MKHLQPIKKRKTIIVALALLNFLLLTSCLKEDFTPKEPANVIDASILSDHNQTEGAIVLGKKLEDPYALKNMEAAYERLKSSNPNTPDLNIKATHKYLRFLPKDETEWQLLKKDTNLVLYDFPLDQEIVIQGTYYHDPDLPETSITWQYCVVPKKYEIPNIHHEKLYDVYIPKKDKNKSSNEAFDQFLLELEYESAKLTDNVPEDESNLKGFVLVRSWTPKGHIKVWDDLIGSTTTYTKVFSHYEYYDCDEGELDPVRRIELECSRPVYDYNYSTTQGMYIPLIGASVHARWFTHIETDVTDENGYFETSDFLYDVNYAIKWERGKYDIRNGMLLQAWFNGPKSGSDWNVNLNTGGKSHMYATIHRAAHKHFYGDNLGIRRPTLPSGKTKICYIDKPGTGVFWGDWSTSGILPDIKIWGKSTLTEQYKPADQVFSTTAHELGHQSHCQFMGNVRFWQVSKIVYESWAEAVQWAFTNDEYHTMGARFGGQNAIDYECSHTNQFSWPHHGGDRAYSPLFIDLIDDFNQRNGGLIGGIIRRACINCPDDRVSGYEISFIQNNILKDAYGLSSLISEVKDNKVSGVTDTDIDILFSLYW